MSIIECLVLFLFAVQESFESELDSQCLSQQLYSYQMFSFVVLFFGRCNVRNNCQSIEIGASNLTGIFQKFFFFVIMCIEQCQKNDGIFFSNIPFFIEILMITILF